MRTAVQGLEAVLAPLMARVTVRPGNGFSRAMNQSLRSYPAIPEIIRRAAEWLARGEQAFNFSGVYVRTRHLYWHLVNEHDDWGADVPVIRRLSPAEVVQAMSQIPGDELDDIDPADHDGFAGTVEFERHATLPYNQFEAAMTIARRIGLICGHGRIALHPDLRPVLRDLAIASGSRSSDHTK